jgi:HEAT repeat protein
MKRQTSLLLVAIAVTGVAATALLFWLYSGDAAVDRSGGRATTDTRDSIGLRGRSGAAAQPSAVERKQGGDGRLRTGGIYTGDRRTPSDSAETIRQRHADSQRVLVILDEIMTVEDRQKRWDLHRELNTLLRRLGHRVDPTVRERLLQLLFTAEPKWRPLVGDALGSLQGDVEAAKALVSIIQNNEAENVYTRHAVYTALRKMNVKEVLPDLMEMLGHGHPDEHLIVKAVAKLAGAEETGALLDMLDGPLRPETRREIQRAVTEKAGSPGLMEKVAKRLEAAPDAQTRGSLVEILGSTREPRYGKTIRKLLDNETDQTVRDSAIRALGMIGDLDSGRRLLDMVERGSSDDQRKAASAMRYIRDGETIEELAQNWDGMGDDARKAVLGAAASLPKPGRDLTELARSKGLFDADLRVRTSAVRVLGQAGEDDNVEAIALYLGRCKHPSEWSAAMRALLTINTKSAAQRGLSYLDVVPDKRTRDNYARQFRKIIERSP